MKKPKLFKILPLIVPFLSMEADAGVPYVKANVGTSFLAWKELSDNDLYWSISAGYEFSQLLKFEVGYEDFGHIKGKYTTLGPNMATNGTIYGSIEAKGVYVAIAPEFGLGKNFHFSPKIGAIYLDSFVGPNFYPTGINQFSEDEFELRIALESRYSLSEFWAVGVEFNYIDADRAEIKALSISTSYKF